MSNHEPKRVQASCSMIPKQGVYQRVRLLGTAASSGRYESSKAKYGWETDSEQVLWRKDEKDFEKRVKRSEIVEKEAVKTDELFERYHGQKLCILYQKVGQNEVKHVKNLGRVWLEGLLWFCQNGFYCPVLKHGPRSLSYMRVCEWWNSYAEWKWKVCKFSTSTDPVWRVWVWAYMVGPERWWTMPE